MADDLLDLITLDNLEGDQRLMAERIGLEGYKALVRYYGGTTVYVSKASTLTIADRNDRIREEYNGYNMAELALKWDLSASSIRDIVRDKREALKQRLPDNQISLF